MLVLKALFMLFLNTTNVSHVLKRAVHGAALHILHVGRVELLFLRGELILIACVESCVFL